MPPLVYGGCGQQEDTRAVTSLTNSSWRNSAVALLTCRGQLRARVPGCMRTLVLDCTAKCLRISSSSSSQKDTGGGWQQRKVSENFDFLKRCRMQTRSSDENSVCPSVCPSVKRVHCDKTEERSVQIFTPYEKERSFSLVF